MRKKTKRLKLKSTFTFDKKIAKGFTKVDYYKAQAANMKAYVFLEEEKRRLSTPKSPYVDHLIEVYKRMGEDHWESPMGKILLRIYEKNKRAAIKKEKVTHNKIMNLIGNAELLMIAYKAIKGNKGAMTAASLFPKDRFNNLTEDQKILAIKTQSLPDKLSLEDIYLTSRLLKKGMYPWGISRRIYFPKPGVKDKLRPITIPPFMDKVVQKAICMVLEAIYEPYFEVTNRSFGFRPNKGTHDAIIALTSNYSSGKKTAIEGDIAAAYDSVNKEKLIAILSEKIKDNKFLKFLRKRLNYTYSEKDGKGMMTYHTPLKGIPQGGIDSPYLFNIYMSKLDDFVHTELQDYVEDQNQENIGTSKTKDTKLKRISNRLWTKASWKTQEISKGQKATKKNLKKLAPKYEQVKKQMELLKLDTLTIKEMTELKNGNNKTVCETIDAFLSVKKELEALRKELFDLISQQRRIRHYKLQINSSDPKKKILKLLYVRYADDWILLTNGDKEIGKRLKDKIATFLKEELELDLSDTKTYITDITKSPAKFLGFQLKHPKRGPIIRKKVTDKNSKKKYNIQRKAGTIIWAAPEAQRLINRYHMKGFCNKNGDPKEIPWISTLEPQIIIERYNSILLGTAEHFLGFVRNASSIQRWVNILRYSCLKTLAQKYKTTIGGIMKRFGHRLTHPALRTVQVKTRLKVGEKIYEKNFTLYTYKDLINKIKSKNEKRTKNDRKILGD